MTAVSASPRHDRVNLLGVGLAASDIPKVLQDVDTWVSTKTKAYICAPDVHLVMQCQWDPALRRVLNAAALTVTDGMPLVWFCRLVGRRNAKRVYGPDLLLAACADGVGKGRRHYFYGGAPGVADALVERLRTAYPGLEVAGVHCPPFRQLSQAEEAEVASAINAARPDIVWVGLGAPKQEFWMARFRPLLDAPLLVGVGAAFDFHSGAKPQAPKALQRVGLEWVFRLASEPRRLWPRYRKVVPAFIYAVALQALGMRRYTLD
jgi:N-acetylglucosaminyldiphosphoundecaprenol N-acetyl-beta-D-mannosaminyltransferase